MSKLIKAKRFETQATISWIDKTEGAPKLKTEKRLYVGKFTQRRVETMLAAAGIIGGLLMVILITMGKKIISLFKK